MKRSVKVEIAGQELTIRSNEGPEYVQELADFVDAHLRELSAGKKIQSLHRLALLVAVQITDELFREKDLHARFRARVEGRLRALEAALADHTARIGDL